MRSIDDIIRASGGPEAIAADAKKHGLKLTHWAVRKWAENGIPSKHWPALIRLSGCTADDLLTANQSIQQKAA